MQGLRSRHLCTSVGGAHFCQSTCRTVLRHSGLVAPGSMNVENTLCTTTCFPSGGTVFINSVPVIHGANRAVFTRWEWYKDKSTCNWPYLPSQGSPICGDALVSHKSHMILPLFSAFQHYAVIQQLGNTSWLLAFLAKLGPYTEAVLHVPPNAFLYVSATAKKLSTMDCQDPPPMSTPMVPWRTCVI